MCCRSTGIGMCCQVAFHHRPPPRSVIASTSHTTHADDEPHLADFSEHNCVEQICYTLSEASCTLLLVSVFGVRVFWISKPISCVFMVVCVCVCVCLHSGIAVGRVFSPFSSAQEIAGLTDESKPRRLGPKRANRIRKLFVRGNRGKEERGIGIGVSRQAGCV
jgi:hypothetical protein